MSVVPNIGRAGSEYDLLLGALGDKGAYARAFNGVMVDSQGGANELLPPSRFPSTIPPEKRDADHTAPLVAPQIFDFVYAQPTGEGKHVSQVSMNSDTDGNMAVQLVDGMEAEYTMQMPDFFRFPSTRFE